MTDPISDMLTRIRNAQMVRKPDVVMPYSKTKHRLAEILESEGYISKVSRDESTPGQPALKCTLKYTENKPVIRSIKRISKPGRRIYVGAKKLPWVFDDLGIAVISTSQGLMTNKQARAKKVGGEIICEIF